MTLDAKVAIVTGGSSGIGRACALRLAEVGFNVGITYRTAAAAAQETVDAIRSTGRRAEASALDLADIEQAREVLEGLVGALGGVSVLVNSAGVNRRAPCLGESLVDWEHVLRINLTGPWLCTQVVARHMVEAGSGGRIINVTSVLGHVPLDGGGAYCASKAGLELLTKVMALELAPDGITVNAVAPGHTATPMNFGDETVNPVDVSRPQIPLGRPAGPEEIASAVAFLALPSGSYTTGASFLVDGGLLLVSGPQQLQKATGLPPKAV